MTVGGILLSRPPVAEAALSPYERLVADSAAADSAAFATLPSGLSTLLDLRPLLTPSALDSLPLAECVVLAEGRPEEIRRRLKLRLSDSTVVVLYASADAMSGSLARVEFLRRTPHEGQRGLIWDRERDHTSSMWWTESGRGVRQRAERGGIPRGGPVPRAVRALARRLFTIPCADSTAQTRQ